MSEPPHEHATQLRNHWWWRPGWCPGREFYTWHLTFTDQHELHGLVAAYQEALYDVPGLDLVPLEWLHLTMQGVGFTDEIPPADIHAIADAAAQRLAQLPPVELTFHRPVVRPEALALAPASTEPLFTTRNAIRSGIATVLGHDQVPETNNRFDPHLSIAYVNTDAPAAALTTALTTIDPVIARLTTTEASLIVLRREDHLYRWDTLARAPFHVEH